MSYRSLLPIAIAFMCIGSDAMSQNDLLSVINAAKSASLSDYVALLRASDFHTVVSSYEQGQGFERLVRGQDTVKVLILKHQRSITFCIESNADCERVLASVDRRRAYKTSNMRRINWVGRYGWHRRSFVYVGDNNGCACEVYLMPRRWMKAPLPSN